VSRAATFTLGMLYGAGLYVVLDYLVFGRYDAAAAAERILREADNAS
jgi:hypothetical protein